MSLPADVATFVARNPELIETAVDVIRAMLDGREKDRIAGMVRLRRRVDAERVRAAAVARAAPPAPSVPTAAATPAPKRRGRAVMIDLAPGPDLA